MKSLFPKLLIIWRGVAKCKSTSELLLLESRVIKLIEKTFYIIMSLIVIVEVCWWGFNQQHILVFAKAVDSCHSAAHLHLILTVTCVYSVTKYLISPVV